MEESLKKTQVEGGDKEILYSKAIKAGKRIYYLDVKKNLKDDLFVAITESKKVTPKDGSHVTFEKHKIFLYKEDFDKFLDGMKDVIGYIQKCKAPEPESSEISEVEETPPSTPSSDGEELEEIKLNIEF